MCFLFFSKDLPRRRHEFHVRPILEISRYSPSVYLSKYQTPDHHSKSQISVSQSNFIDQKHKTNLSKFFTLFIRKLNHRLLLNVHIGYQPPALCNQFNVTTRLLDHVCNNCGHICIRYEIPPGNSGFGSLKLTQYIRSR